MDRNHPIEMKNVIIDTMRLIPQGLDDAELDWYLAWVRWLYKWDPDGRLPVEDRSEITPDRQA